MGGGGVVNLSGRACKFGQCEGNQRLVNNRSRIHGWHLPSHETTAQPNNTQHHHINRFLVPFSNTLAPGKTTFNYQLLRSSSTYWLDGF